MIKSAFKKTILIIIQKPTALELNTLAQAETLTLYLCKYAM